MGETNAAQKVWYADFVNHLAFLGGGLGDGTRKEDLGAIAEIRASARGGSFEIRALRHVVPYLEGEQSARFQRRVKIALIVGQVFALCRMKRSAEDDADQGDSSKRPETIGRKLGLLEGSRSLATNKGDSDKKGRSTPTPMERFLQTVVATDFDQIGNRLRNAAARIKQSGIPMRYADYRQLLHDLDWWDDPEHRVQYRWVEEFYHARYRSDKEKPNEEEEHNED